jgi:hypothetical protein
MSKPQISLYAAKYFLLAAARDITAPIVTANSTI